MPMRRIMRLRRIVRPRHVRQQQRALAGRAQPGEAVDGVRECVHAVMDDAPEVEDEAVEALGERGEAWQVFHRRYCARRSRVAAHRVLHRGETRRRAARRRARASAAGSAPVRHRRTRCRAAPAMHPRGSWSAPARRSTRRRRRSARAGRAPAGRHAPAPRWRAGTAARRTGRRPRRASGERRPMGRVIVVFDTISPCTPSATQVSTMAASASSPRSGAIFTSSGGRFGTRSRHGTQDRAQAAPRPAGRAAPACSARRR